MDVMNEIAHNVTAYENELIEMMQDPNVTKVQISAYYNRVTGTRKFAMRMAHCCNMSAGVKMAISNKYDDLKSRAYIFCEGLEK